MSHTTLPQPQRSDAVQVELVSAGGSPIAQRPIRIEELLQQQNHTVDIGNGIALRLEELNAEENYSDDDVDSAPDDSADDEEGSEMSAEGVYARGQAAAAPPPGTRAAGGWYDVLDALRREQMDVMRTAAEVQGATRDQGNGESRILSRHTNEARSAATPLKRFSQRRESAGKSVSADTAPESELPLGASRREVWASLVSAKDARRYNYKVLRYVSYMPALDFRRFRPTALAFHAAASYLSRKDRGQRLLVYGGVSFGARSVEQELYEFSVLTGNWRRIEGRQLVPAGHYGHTMTVAESLDRLVVVGGIGPGGAVISKKTRQEWATDPLRAPRYRLLCPLLHRRAGQAVTAPARLGGTAAPLPPASAPASIGFVSLLFDMNLSDHTWRAIQPAVQFPLAFHTAVHFGNVLYVFGGLTENLRVSGQLLAINLETYAARLIQTSACRGRRRVAPGEEAEEEEEGDDLDADEAAGPKPRFLHTAVRHGPYMIVYGGYDASNEVLGDCWAFDMMNERWEQLRCRSAVVGRAGHECCVIGCRMLVTGGFESSLDEVGTAASPVATVMELNLLPTLHEEHMWRAEVRVRPPLPPLAFTQCAPCGDGHSFLLFGGLTKPARHLPRSPSAGNRSASAKRRAVSSSEDESDTDDTAGSDADAGHHRSSDKAVGRAASAAACSGLWKRFAPFDDGLVLTFPEKRHRAKRAKDEQVVNALGVEVDPGELPEHFKAFVRRQEDFVKKKDSATTEIIRKTTLQEQEDMGPTLYLTPDEIELLIHRSEECCVAFAESYKMGTLPSNIPDREERVHLIEECISESRQMRDVMRSMKGSAPGVTAVKSKTHRTRAGQKFEDYSAAKPFRRVVVKHLIESINQHLSRMRRLNKALRTVEWPEKEGFLKAVDGMQNAVHSVSRAINGVLNKYITRRVESLMKGVDRHKEVMRLLTQVVEKNQHDKIWGVKAARDEKRQEQQRARAAVATPGQRASTAQQARSKRRALSTAARRGDAPPVVMRGRTARSRSLGGGYHPDESKAVVYIIDLEVNDLLRRASRVEKCAGQLRRCCEEGAVVSGVASLPPQAPCRIAGAQPPLQAPHVVPAATIPPPQIAPPVLLPTGVPLADLVVGAAPSPSQAEAPAPTDGEAGVARPRDVTIQHSNELRRTMARLAEGVRKAAVGFRTAIVQATAEMPPTLSVNAPLPSKRSPSMPVPSQTAQGAGAVNDAIPTPQLPAPTAEASFRGAAAMTTAVALDTQSSPSRTSSSSSSGSSRSSPSLRWSSAPAAAAAKHDPSAPQPLRGSAQLQQPVTAPLALKVDAAPASVRQLHPTPAVRFSRDAAANASHGSRSAKTTSGAPAAASVAQRRAVCLSALRPILAAKASLLKLQDKVAQIRVNTWDGRDLAGAPQDVRVEELFKRLSALVAGVAQCITASLLTKAGARPPRTRPVPVSVGPPPRRSRSKTVTGGARSRSGSAKGISPSKSLASAATVGTGPKAVVLPPASFSAVERSERRSSRNGDDSASGAPYTAADDGVKDVLRLLPLPPPSTDCDGETGDWWPTSVSRPTEKGAAGVPLVSNEALLRDVAPTAATSRCAAASSVVEVRPVYPNARTTPNFKPPSLVCDSVVSPTIAGPWAPAASPMGTSSSVPVNMPAPIVALSVAPKVVMPAGVSDMSTDEPGALPTPTPPPRRRSTIAALTQLRHPSHSRLGDGSCGSGMPSSCDSRDPVTRESATSITSGNFVVNAEYLSRVEPDALLGTAGTQENLRWSDGDARHAWADVDEDYFYFGRRLETRMTSAETAACGPPYISARPSGAVGVSPPVGTVLRSPRMNAELVVPPMRGHAGVTSASSAPRARSSSARRRTRDHQASGHYLSSTASQSLKSHTVRPVVRKEGGKHRFYTPGELQLIEARERLRSKPAK
ncbi:hypothetical protein LSCM1_02244 [Leishmania martiniquensis]|uniref:Uncharacterized protein n=1 Tax=Leishmania martiniquensis TaxID=1580590 RepID=A0A836GZX4_9TRYP|nr:hypothetical protein LSCM1_02244 [Leishmania martiniquensis]